MLDTLRACAQGKGQHGTELPLKVKVAIGVITLLLGLMTVVVPVLVIPGCNATPPPNFVPMPSLVRRMQACAGPYRHLVLCIAVQLFALALLIVVAPVLDIPAAVPHRPSTPLPVLGCMPSGEARHVTLAPCPVDRAQHPLM